ncbi:MAG: CARDB domain-containing protein [bacterium]|nr:CARDB domain-containing protein [bacterium]
MRRTLLALVFVGFLCVPSQLRGQAGQLPDLIITALTAPAQGTIGASLSGVNVTVRNQGNGAAGPFLMGFYFSRTPNLTTPVVFTGTTNLVSKGLQPEQYAGTTVHVSIPTSLSPGIYFLFAVADDQAVVVESDKKNNWRFSDSGPVTLVQATDPAQQGSLYLITTVAGSGIQGYSGDGGAAVSASLSYPLDVAVHPTGKLYILHGGVVRMVDKQGVITTVAGGNFEGACGDGDNGPATSAHILDPVAVALDGGGNLYIADFQCHRIWKVDNTGVVRSIVGTAKAWRDAGYGGDGGPATAALLAYPSDVVIDPAGNLYIADSQNRRVRKVNAAGIISTIAGNGRSYVFCDQAPNGDGGPALVAGFCRMGSLALDRKGNLYITDGDRVRKVNPNGIITTVAGTGIRGYSGDGGRATDANLNVPSGVAVDSVGNLYISDTLNQRIRKVDETGMITTVAGTGVSGYSGDGGLATAAQFQFPQNLDLDITGNLFVADLRNHRIRKLISSGPVPYPRADRVLIVPGVLGTKLALPNRILWLSNDALRRRVWDGEHIFEDLAYDLDGNPVVALTTDTASGAENCGGLFNLNDCPNGSSQYSLRCDTLDVNLFSDETDCRRSLYVYNDLFNSLSAEGYSPDVFPYDWRMDIGQLGEQLFEKLQELAKAHPEETIGIVTHSMGGLVVGETLRRHGPELFPVLGPVITLATPFQGSVQPYLYFQGWASLNSALMSSRMTQRIGANWTSAYEVLPRWNFVRLAEGDFTPYPDIYNGSYDSAGFSRLPRTDSALPLAYSLWRVSDGTAPYPGAFAIIGSGQLTASEIIIERSGGCPQLRRTNGDGTVPIASALGSSWVPAPNISFIDDSHSQIPSNAKVIVAVVRLLRGSAPLSLLSTPAESGADIVPIACDAH